MTDNRRIDRSQAISLFGEIVGRRDEEIDLARAALVFARHEYPGLDIDGYLARIDLLAQRARHKVHGPKRAGSGKMNPLDAAAALSSFLFEEEGFRGNSEDYYDPRNSYLNQVLERKLGIPITLSVLYMEVGWRLGLQLAGVGMPGHFMVKLLGVEGVYIDPFASGAIISEYECQERLDAIYGGELELRPEFLQAVGKKQILARMLANLKMIYMQRGELEKALDIIEMILLVEPQNSLEIRDRGLLRGRLGAYAQSIADLELYLRLAPDAEDAGEMRENLKMLRQMLARMN